MPVPVGTSQIPPVLLSPKRTASVATGMVNEPKMAFENVNIALRGKSQGAVSDCTTATPNAASSDLVLHILER